ncbi:MAG: hypothetical protein EBR82_57485 [Caulobacteraceae bacterium]|nr:hypothetical protein [Caulobacteraceae bacterium]
MPLIETKGAASAQGFGEFTVVGPPPVYIEDVFSTWLYTGNSSTQTITNGINLSGKGGLVWLKKRTAVSPDTYTTDNHYLFDTNRGGDVSLSTNLTNGNISGWSGLFTGFTSTGFGLNTSVHELNASSSLYASWTFRKQPKFFDIVTYTGTGAAQTINHNLGSVPGCIIIKTLSTSDNWRVYHRSIGNQYVLTLNSDLYQIGPSAAHWNNTDPTSTQFTVGTNGSQSSTTYIAYLFAHDAGGFGLAGTDNVISCGSFTTDGSGNVPAQTLGYEPQWIMYKRTDNLGSWLVFDTFRGWFNNTGYSDSVLQPNNSNAEAFADGGTPTATGFASEKAIFSGSATYIYIAIRRGPMKTPTSGTSVFAPVTRTGTGASATITGVGFPPDLAIIERRQDHTGQYNVVSDRLRGATAWLGANSTEQEYNNSNMVSSFNMDGISVGSEGSVNAAYAPLINWFFRRAPSFFDEVCYTGTGSATTQAHNLGVAPEMMIVKSRANTGQWSVYASARGANQVGQLQSTVEFQVDTNWNFTAPTSSVFSISGGSNISSYTYVAYLFATCAGVSKVGSYTGTGALQTINCGFTGGARFVLIKRTDSTGDWWVYDSARGISSGNDPYLFLNSTAAEVTGTNYVDTTSVGFQVTAAAPAGLNANGGTYIFLAIA